MTSKIINFVALSLALMFAACGDDNSSTSTEQNVSDSKDISVSVNEVSGVSQKGPFLMGSKVQMFEISNGRSLNQTGKSFNGKISNDKGEFKIKGSKLVSQYVTLEASGYYRNEITGNNSKSELTLLAISNVSDRNTININLLTHLEYERVIYLVTQQKMKVDEAKKQAQREIFQIFGIDNTKFSNSEDLNIAGTNDDDGALLAISVLLQGDRNESQLSELLTKIAIDMEEDGEWNDDAQKNAIAEWAAEIVHSGRIATIRGNVEKWKLSNVVPNFEKYVNNFWWQNYGLGTCDAKREGEVLKNQNTASSVANEYYICKSGAWQVASDFEKDTYKWLDSSVNHVEKDGDVRYGDVVKTNCYVFEDKTWRSGNSNDCSLGLRGCTKLRQDTLGKSSDKTWYICDNKNWREASTVEFDTYQIECSKNGAIVDGKINTNNKYVCDGGIFRIANKLEINADSSCTSYNRNVFYILPHQHSYYKCTEKGWVISTEKKNQGTMVDERDGKVYKTVWVDNQLWMAENLNYADSVNYPSMLGKNWCMDDKDSCEKYGRYYTWSAAIDSVYWSKQGKKCSEICGDINSTCVLPDTVQGICPKGWHIPNIKEWAVLNSTMEQDTYNIRDETLMVYEELYKAISTIPSCYSEHNYIDDRCDGAFFWSSTIDNYGLYMCPVYWGMDVFLSGRNVGHLSGLVGMGLSVRCIKDSE